MCDLTGVVVWPQCCWSVMRPDASSLPVPVASYVARRRPRPGCRALAFSCPVRPSPPRVSSVGSLTHSRDLACAVEYRGMGQRFLLRDLLIACVPTRMPPSYRFATRARTHLRTRPDAPHPFTQLFNRCDDIYYSARGISRAPLGCGPSVVEHGRVPRAH